MSASGEREILRDRLRAFLLFVRPRTLPVGDRLSQLRRLSDVRIRRYALGRPRVTSADLSEFLADPKTGRFDVLADAAGLLRQPHLDLALEPLGEDMGIVVEACLLPQVLGSEATASLLKEFVASRGVLADSPSARVAPKPAAAPLPPEIARILGTAKDLWTLPAHTLSILRLLQTSDVQPDAVAAEIGKDPALADQCLRTVNSIGFGLGAPVTSLKRAVVTIGYTITQRIVAIAALTSRLGRAHEDVDFDFASFWTHALRTAHTASLVSRTSKFGHPDEHFAAGLLHDIGKLVIYQHLREPLKRILAAVKDGEDYEAAERRLLGVGHAEIGACLCERWRFPALVVAAARHHLDPADVLEETQLPREALVVAAACRLARKEADVARWTPFLRLPPERVEEIRAEAGRRAQGSLKEFLAVT